jgi:hypothetical protein
VDGVGPAARFNEPWGIAVGPGGHIFITDSGNHTIRKLSPGGEVSTLAGAAGQAPSADEDPPRHADDGAARPLEFIRVHVPNGRLADVPLGDERYVPMSAREFEDGMTRLGAGDGGRHQR